MRNSRVSIVVLMLVFFALLGANLTTYSKQVPSNNYSSLHVTVEAPEGTPEPGQNAHHISLVGAVNLGNESADITVYKDLAIVGTYCSERGVNIIDLSDPANPQRIARTEDMDATSMEDVKVIRTDDRDVLAIGLQACGRDGSGTTGLALVDITTPAEPETIGIIETNGGVHEFDLTTTPGGRALALLAIPGQEASSINGSSVQDDSGLVIVDITDPENPEQLTRWNIREQLKDFAFTDALRGSLPMVYLHSVRANAKGTMLYLSYWDAGTILLDINDPAEPIFLSRIPVEVNMEGNAHSATETKDGKVLIQANEDFSPQLLTVESDVLDRVYNGYEVMPRGMLRELVDRPRVGEVIGVGTACEPIAEELAGKIAIVERGECTFPMKIDNAQNAGAMAVIMYEPEPLDEIVLNEAARKFRSTSIEVDLNIPTVFLATEAAKKLVDNNATVTISAIHEGYGQLRFFDISDPHNPKLISEFGTENSKSDLRGTYTVHNPEIIGDRMYASWYVDGVRMVDVGDPTQPREIGFWTGGGDSDDVPSSVFIWSVLPYKDMMVASDMEYGVYVLKPE